MLAKYWSNFIFQRKLSVLYQNQFETIISQLQLIIRCFTAGLSRAGHELRLIKYLASIRPSQPRFAYHQISTWADNTGCQETAAIYRLYWCLMLYCDDHPLILVPCPWVTGYDIIDVCIMVTHDMTHVWSWHVTMFHVWHAGHNVFSMCWINNVTLASVPVVSTPANVSR